MMLTVLSMFTTVSPPTLHPCQGSKHSNIYIYRMTNFPFFISKSLTILLIFSRRRHRSTGHILHLESHCSAGVHPEPTRSEEINICLLTSQLLRLIADNCTTFYPPPCCLQEGLKWVLRNVGFHRLNIFLYYLSLNLSLDWIEGFVSLITCK